jgi:hypothetical protein
MKTMVSNQYSEKDPSVWALCFGRNHAKFPNHHQDADVSLSWENKMIYQQDNTYTGKCKSQWRFCHRKKKLLPKYHSLKDYLAVGNSRSTMSSTWRASWGASGCLPARNIARWWRSARAANLITTRNTLWRLKTEGMSVGNFGYVLRTETTAQRYLWPPPRLSSSSCRVISNVFEVNGNAPAV